MTHAAVAPGNPGFLDEDIEKRLVATNTLKKQDNFLNVFKSFQFELYDQKCVPHHLSF